MKVATYYFILILSIVFIFAVNNILTPDSSTLRCESEILIRQKIDEEKTISTHAELHYVVGPKGKGLVNIYGSATENSTTYLLSRTLFFSYINIDNNDIYEINYHGEIINKTDNTPEQLADYLSFSTKKSISYIRVSKINDNLVILKRLSSPVVMCKKF